MKSVSPAIVMAHARIRTAKNPEKKTESVKAVQESVLNTDAGDSVVLAQRESPVKVSSDTANVPETRVIGPKTEDAAAYISRGVLCLKKGQIEDAISDFNKAIDLDPGRAVAYIARGSAYYDLDRFDIAISDYSKAIEINPDLAAAYQNRGSVYQRQGRFDNAISDYCKALELNPEDAAIYTCRGTVYLAQGHYQKAFFDFNKAIELDPEDVNAYVSRGSYYHTRKKHRKAIADYRKALELKPEAAFGKRLREYLHYDSALFLINIVNYCSFVDRTG